MRSATTFTTPSLRSSLPDTSSAPASRATARCRFQHPWDTTTFINPVSSSRFMNVVPCAVIGRCRCVTTPAMSTLDPGSAVRRSSAVRTPRAASASRTNRVGWPSGDTPVAQRSATAMACSSIPGRQGACTPETMPGSRPGLDSLTAPAAHSASRRDMPKQANAPAVANDSSCTSVSAGTRRTRSSGDANGCAASMACATA